MMHLKWDCAKYLHFDTRVLSIPISIIPAFKGLLQAGMETSLSVHPYQELVTKGNDAGALFLVARLFDSQNGGQDRSVQMRCAF